MLASVLRIRDVYPGSDFFPSRIRTVSIPDPGSSSKNLSILTPKKSKKMVSKLKQIWSGLFIPDPDADFLPSRIPDPGVKKAPNPGSGSATLVRVSLMSTQKVGVSFHFFTCVFRFMFYPDSNRFHNKKALGFPGSCSKTLQKYDEKLLFK